ncbi:serine hydrolase [Streptomyces sp. NPDC054933]
MYESGYGLFEPPRDFSVYDMSWGWTAGAVVSTMEDLNRFYRELLTGRLLPAAQLAQMETTVPTSDASGIAPQQYGLGLLRINSPCGTFWSHNGAVFGANTWALSSPDGKRQLAFGYNLSKYDKLDANGVPVNGPIDDAIYAFMAKALCGTDAPAAEAPTAPIASMDLADVSRATARPSVPFQGDR